MIFMYYIVPDLQIVKTVDRGALILLYAAFFLFPHTTEDIALRNDNKTQFRILEPAAYISACHHDFARFEHMLHLPVVKCRDVIFLQIFTQPASSRLRGGD